MCSASHELAYKTITPIGAPAMPHPTDRAPMSLRIAAAAIDLLALGPPVAAALYGWLRLARAGTLPRFLAVPSLTAVLVLLPLGYSLLEVLHGATPGKRLLHLRILRERGKLPSRLVLLARWAWKTIPLAVLLTGITLATSAGRAQRDLWLYTIDLGSLLTLVLLISFFPAAGIERQTFYDILTETAVYRRPPHPLSHGFEPIVPAAATPQPCEHI